VDYLDFELEIGPRQGHEYPLRVLNSPAGQANEMLHFPYNEQELKIKLQALQIALLRSGGHRRQTLSPEQKTVRDFGQDLFDALLTGETRVRYDVSQEKARQQDKGVRIKLRINTPDLAALPWEFLYDPRRADYVCLARDTSVVRYLEFPRPIQPLTIKPPLRILGMVASPKDLPILNIKTEKRRIEQALQGLQAQGLVELTWLEGQTWRHLQRAIRHGPWHIFHFIGHGGFDTYKETGFVVLADECGNAKRLEAKQLGRLLGNHRKLRLTILNSCEGAHESEHDLFSSTASTLVRYGIPAVVAMQYAITDRAAIEFVRMFYEALSDNLPIDEAIFEARLAVSMEIKNTIEWGTPVLYTHTPDGVLFTRPAELDNNIGGWNMAANAEYLRSREPGYMITKSQIEQERQALQQENLPRESKKFLDTARMYQNLGDYTTAREYLDKARAEKKKLYVQLLEEDGCPTGHYVQQSKAHEDGLLHAICHTFLILNKTKIYLQKRASDKVISPDKWTTSSCGHVIAEETLREAARRELYEELRFSIPDKTRLKDVGHIPVLSTGPQNRRCNAIAYIFCVNIRRPIEGLFNKREIAEVKIMPIDQVKAMLDGEQSALDFAHNFVPIFYHFWDWWSSE